ncbi:MAG: SDR family NAD(P)-dependent oxidoreductase, partial [Dehalococcoidia bacterium]
GWRGIESVAQEVQALGRRALTLYADLRSSDQIQDLVSRVVEHFGRIDILVNNARATSGIDNAPITELSEEVWNAVMTLNTTAVFLCTKLVAREMVRLGNGGRIINIGSQAGKQAFARRAAYSASKFAVLGLTQSTALDLAPYGITVNAVCPGQVNTNRVDAWEQARAAELGIPMEELREQLVQERARATPLGRIAEPEDVANLVAFLASDEASFITGQGYNVNGGILFH